MNKNLPVIIIGLVALVAIIGGVYLYNNGNPKPAMSTSNSYAVPKASPTAPRTETAPAGAQPAWSKGAPNAVVTLEEFADFQCPSCAYFQPTLKEIRTAYGDRVRIIFRQYPLQMHPKAFDASRATEAAGVQGKFWEMHDLIYQKQKDWSLPSVDHRKEFENYAKSLGLDAAKFSNDMISDNATRRVTLDKQRGDYIQIRATPSIFLNGRLLTPEEMEVNKLRQLIDAALQPK